ncbi:hypothetical protein PILCRDRAFT_532258 [Piloderma croceum F 1598]|uniref:Uncharacterized protein n=1 Tax=Piloderma croceum (strain F 1598) TaxID=765440 RepID=A0A0C3FLL4_PILCF|nr:hypothetical protein PILCRDRAFT_532258 [Piloderma croceum F 1598]
MFSSQTTGPNIGPLHVQLAVSSLVDLVPHHRRPILVDVGAPIDERLQYHPGLARSFLRPVGLTSKGLYLLVGPPVAPYRGFDHQSPVQ